MKKIALVTIVALAMFANGSIAQEVYFGPKAGLNLSNVYDAEGENFNADPKIGYVAGLFLSLPLGSVLGIQPEVLFSQKGFKASGSVFGDEYSFTRTQNYIDIPLLFVVKPSEFFSIVAGPQYSYLISSKDAFESSFLNIESQEEFDNDNLRKNTVCFTGGFDVNLELVVIGARVGWDLFKNNGDGTSTTPRYKNVWYQATIGLRL